MFEKPSPESVIRNAADELWMALAALDTVVHRRGFQNHSGAESVRVNFRAENGQDMSYFLHYEQRGNLYYPSLALKSWRTDEVDIYTVQDDDSVHHVPFTYRDKLNEGDGIFPMIEHLLKMQHLIVLGPRHSRWGVQHERKGKHGD